MYVREGTVAEKYVRLVVSKVTYMTYSSKIIGTITGKVKPYVFGDFGQRLFHVKLLNFMATLPLYHHNSF